MNFSRSSISSGSAECPRSLSTSQYKSKHITQHPKAGLNIHIAVKRDILQPQLLQHPSRHLTKLVLDDLIIATMGQEERRVLIGEVLGDKVLGAVAQQQVARQTKHTTQLLLMRQAGEHGNGTTLRESTQHDPRGRDALVVLFLDEAVEVVTRAEDAGFVLGANELCEIKLEKECHCQYRLVGENVGRNGNLTSPSRAISYHPGMLIPMF